MRANTPENTEKYSIDAELLLRQKSDARTYFEPRTNLETAAAFVAGKGQGHAVLAHDANAQVMRHGKSDGLNGWSMDVLDLLLPAPLPLPASSRVKLKTSDLIQTQPTMKKRHCIHNKMRDTRLLKSPYLMYLVNGIIC